MSMPAKREMVEAVKRLATKTPNTELKADLKAILEGINVVLKEHDMTEVEACLVNWAQT